MDRARTPSAYQDLKIGNEVLIIGPNQSGKKSLAQRIAQMAGMERLVTVYNPRDSDALAKAKDIVRGYKRKKVMLLLPRIDLAYQMGDPELLAELDALIETTSEASERSGGGDDRLVCGRQRSGQHLRHQTGASRRGPESCRPPGDLRRGSARLIRGYSFLSLRGTAPRLSTGGNERGGIQSRILECVVNPAEIEDIVVLCQTTALYRQRTRKTSRAIFTREILETAIARVVAR